MRLPLKILIFSTVGISLLAVFFPIVYGLLVLSSGGIQKLFLWQLITYIFVERGPISLTFFITLIFQMYVLWIFGTQLMERAHARLFFLLYFGAALIGALSALLVPHTFLAGSINGVYAILVAWMLLNQDAKLLFFFTIHLKSQWLIVGLVGASILMDLAVHHWAGAVSLLVACLYSYFFTLIVWRQPGPFFFLRRMEKRIFQFLERQKKHETYISSKIYDIKSGEPILEDDQFMDACLDRISRHGEESLTPAERKRMREISSRKK